jgi:Flp pilus assembly protein TadD
MRKAWSAIYAERHASDEPNPLASAIANAGAALAAEGKMPEAEALIREAVGVDPSAARVHSMLGILLSEQGRLPEAASELQTAKRLSFRETEARTELGFVLLKLGREEEALVELRDVLRVDRRAPRPYVGVGMILARRNRVPEAISALRTAIAVDPTYGPAQLELAGVLDTVGQPAEAWAAAERAHDLGEDVPSALWQRLADKVPTAPPLPPTCAGAPGPAIDLDRPDAASRAYVTKVRSASGPPRLPRVAGEARRGGRAAVERTARWAGGSPSWRGGGRAARGSATGTPWPAAGWPSRSLPSRPTCRSRR